MAATAGHSRQRGKRATSLTCSTVCRRDNNICTESARRLVLAGLAAADRSLVMVQREAKAGERGPRPGPDSGLPRFRYKDRRRLNSLDGRPAFVRTKKADQVVPELKRCREHADLRQRRPSMLIICSGAHISRVSLKLHVYGKRPPAELPREPRFLQRGEN